MAIQRQDPLYIVYNCDSNGNKISLPITNEQQQVVTGQFTLVQVPDPNYHVTFPNDITMYEIDIKQQITSNKQYKVDYNYGIVYVHSDLEADIVYVNYRGKGVIKYPATRIYDTSENVPVDTAKSLQHYIDRIKELKFEEFDPTKIYKINKIVAYNNSTYICIQETINHQLPTDAAYWDVFAAGFDYRGNYDNTISYARRDVVWYDTEKAMYVCIQSSTGHLPTDSNYWKMMFSLKSQLDYAKEQGDYAKAQGDYAKAEGDYANTQTETITTEYGIIKNDYLNATYTETWKVDNGTYIATSDNTTYFDLQLGFYNHLIDILEMSYKGVPLIEGKHYNITGLTVTLLGWAINTGDEIDIKVEKGSKDTIPAGTDGTALMQGTVGEEKLTDDVKIKLNKNTIIQDYVFTATVDNTTTFTIASDIFNPDADHLSITYKGTPLVKDENYSLTGYQVILGFAINTGEKIGYEITKQIGFMIPVMPDGSIIQNGTISEQKLTEDARIKLNNTQQEVVNARKGENLLLDKIDKIDNHINVVKNLIDYPVIAPEVDDSLRIKRAVQSLVDAGGGVLLIPQTTVSYKVSQSISISATGNIKLSIIGIGNPVIESTANIILFEFKSSILPSTDYPSRIMRIMIDGIDLKGYNQTGVGLRFQSFGFITLRNMYISNFDTGLYMKDGSEANIYHVRCEGNQHGAKFIRSNESVDADLAAIDITGYSAFANNVQNAVILDGVRQVNLNCSDIVASNGSVGARIQATYRNVEQLNFNQCVFEGFSPGSKCLIVGDTSGTYKMDYSASQINIKNCHVGVEIDNINKPSKFILFRNLNQFNFENNICTSASNLFTIGADMPLSFEFNVQKNNPSTINYYVIDNRSNNVIQFVKRPLNAMNIDFTKAYYGFSANATPTLDKTNFVTGIQSLKFGSGSEKYVSYTFATPVDEGNIITGEMIYNFSAIPIQVVLKKKSDSTISTSQSIDYHIAKTFANSFKKIAFSYTVPDGHTVTSIRCTNIANTSSDFYIDNFKVFSEGIERTEKIALSAEPTLGTWSLGDKVYNSSVSAGGYEGWICIVSGEPGAFKGFGLIQS